MWCSECSTCSAGDWGLSCKCKGFERAPRGDEVSDVGSDACFTSGEADVGDIEPLAVRGLCVVVCVVAVPKPSGVPAAGGVTVFAFGDDVGEVGGDQPMVTNDVLSTDKRLIASPASTGAMSRLHHTCKKH